MWHSKTLVPVGFMLLVFSLLSASSLCAGENENIKQWIGQLSDRRERAAAKQNLIKARERATPELLNVLNDEYAKSSVRTDIVQIFEINKTNEAIPALKEALKSPTARLRVASIKALGTMADEKLADTFKEAIKDPEPAVRATAISALKKLKNRSAIPIFIESLSDKNADVRLNALDALIVFNDISTIPPLIERLNDPAPSVILKAVEALSNYKDKQVVRALVKRLKTGNRQVKIRVIEAFAKIKDKSVLPQLETLQNDEYIEVQRAAKKAIKTIEG